MSEVLENILYSAVVFGLRGALSSLTLQPGTKLLYLFPGFKLWVKLNSL
jgi:hypothetical protein